MFFWIGVLVIVVVFVSVLAWGLRGFEDREHKPGTQRLF
jgi:flagellar biogenesis protein FliO